MSWYNNLKTGDELISGKDYYDPIKHHAVILVDAKYGRKFVVDTTIGVGVKMHPIESYLQTNNIIEVNKYKGTQEDCKIVSNRAKALLGTPYKLFQLNCEHLSNFLRFGKLWSKQLLRYLIIVAILIMAVIVYFKFKKNKIL